MRPRFIRTKLDGVLLALAGALVLLLLVEEVPRVLFPWDLRVYSESPFLTTMLKLTAGEGPYTQASDSNSYIYSPGLAYLTYGLLRPLGAQLDIRACRAVTVAISVLSAVVAGGLVERLWRSLSGTAKSLPVRVLASAIAALLVFTNYTADACHPDGLYALHAMLLIALTADAIESGDQRRAMVVLALAGAGVLVKQTAVFGLAGAALSMLWFCGRRWGTERSALLALWGLACVAGASGIVLHGWGSYWAFELISREPVQWFRFYELVGQVTTVPHRLFVAVAFAPCALFLGMQGDEKLRKVLAAWAAIGLTEVLPSLGAYLKIWGSWNNLVIVESWMALPVLAVAIHFVGLGREQALGAGARAVAGGALVTLLVSLVPTRAAPTDGQVAFGLALDESIRRDAASGKRVLVSHGASTLIHNGITSVPLDRAVSALELASAGNSDFTEMRGRFAKHAYDKVYLLTPPPYSQEVQATIDANYHQVGEIPGDGAPLQDELSFGTQSFMHWPVRVLEAN